MFALAAMLTPEFFRLMPNLMVKLQRERGQREPRT